jgi:hypothetical protein
VSTGNEKIQEFHENPLYKPLLIYAADMGAVDFISISSRLFRARSRAL